MKLAIIGTGMIVSDLLQTISTIKLQDLSIWGRDREKSEKLAKDYTISTIFDRFEDVLESDFDTIYIAISNHVHFDYTKKALLAGKNVILEKPATPTLAEFRALRQLAKQQGKMLIEAVTTHYLPAYQAIHSELEKLGQIKIVSLNYSQYSSRYDRFKAGETPTVFDPSKAGGALVDLNVYNLHFAVGLFGEPRSWHYSANVERGIDTSGILLMNYDRFQAVCIGAKDCQAPIMLSIQGDKGNIVVPMPANSMNCYQLNLNNGESQKFEFSTAHRMSFEFQRFVEIIDNHDFATMEKMLDVSEIVCNIVEQGRKQQGILFAGEN